MVKNGYNKQSLVDKVTQKPNKLSSMTQIKVLNQYITLLFCMNHLMPLSSSGWRRSFFFVIPRQIYHLYFHHCLILPRCFFGSRFASPLFDLTVSFGCQVKPFWAFVPVFFPSFSVLFSPDLNTFSICSWGDWLSFCLVAPFPSFSTGFGDLGLAFFSLSCCWDAFPSYPIGFRALGLAFFTLTCYWDACPSFPTGFSALGLASSLVFFTSGRKNLYLWLPLFRNHLGGWCCWLALLWEQQKSYITSDHCYDIRYSEKETEAVVTTTLIDLTFIALFFLPLSCYHHQ